MASFYAAKENLTMTIAEMLAIKRKFGLTDEEISDCSGVPIGTVQKLLSGKTRSPREADIQALEKFFTEISFLASILPPESDPAETPSSVQEAGESRTSSRLAEPAAPYRTKKQGEYTLEDYYALPAERRVELIDGEFFDMAAPSALHQLIIGELYLQFRQCINEHCPSCRVLLSPCDVRLDRDDKTMLQPDLIVLCGAFDIRSRFIDGAPDLTVEILSESTKSRDLLLKTHKYDQAGVKEYWIIDPEKPEVLVYDFAGDDLEKYTFDDQVPIRISNGSCKIDFALIRKNLGL